MNNGNDHSLASGPGPSRRAVLSGGAAVLAAIGAGALAPGTAHAAPRIPAAGSAAVTGASASVSANGTYTVTTASPAFTFTGTVGVAATNITASTAGSDAVGAYHEIDFQYTAGGYARTASIRTYDSLPVVLFSTTYVDNSDNVSPYYAFPAFTKRPSLTYSETFRRRSVRAVRLQHHRGSGLQPVSGVRHRRRVPDLPGFALRHRRHQDHQRRVQQRHLGRDHQHPGRAELPHGPGVRRRLRRRSSASGATP